MDARKHLVDFAGYKINLSSLFTASIQCCSSRFLDSPMTRFYYTAPQIRQHYIRQILILIITESVSARCDSVECDIVQSDIIQSDILQSVTVQSVIGKILSCKVWMWHVCDAVSYKVTLLYTDMKKTDQL